MAQIQKKFIAANAVDDTKIKLRNNQPLRARNAADSADINILKVNASDKVEFSSVPQATSDASAGNDLVRYSQFAAALDGLKPKQAVVAASTGNIDLSVASDPNPVDGVTLANNDRILLWQQTADEENGIYIAVDATDPTTWTRSSDFNATSEIPGAYTVAEFGTLYQGVLFVCTSSPGTIDVDPINFALRTISVNTYTGGDMITLTGNAFSVDLATTSGLESSNPGNAAGQLRAKVDNSTIDINGSNQLEVKSGGITNTQVNASAAIAYSKLNLSLSIVNADINAGAAIDYTKLATLTANRALVSNPSGYVSASTVTDTELGYVSGVTSAIQTQLDGKANRALSNLASVAINTSLLPGSDATIDLGSSSLQFNNAFIKSKIESNAAAGGVGTGFIIQSKNVTGAVNSANVALLAGTVDTSGQTSGSAVVRSADCSVAGTSSGTSVLRSGDVTATSGAGVSGQVNLRSGNIAAGTNTGASGSMSFVSGTQGAGNSGATGAVSLGSGNNSGSGNSGAVTLSSGTVSGGTRGSVSITGNTINLSGSGTVSSALDINPSADNSKNLGSASLNYASANALIYKSNADLTIQPNSGNKIVLDSSVGTEPATDNVAYMGTSTKRFTSVGAAAINSGSSALSVVSTGSVNFNSVKLSSVADPAAAQDAVTRAFHDAAAGDMIAVSSSVYSVDLASSSGLESTNPGNAAGQLRAKVDAATVKINGSNQLEALKGNEEHITLSGTDITNQYIDLAHAVYGASAAVNSISLDVYGGLEQLKGTDYTVSLTGGSGGVTRITFAGDLATGGPAALIATDILMIKYSYLT